LEERTLNVGALVSRKTSVYIYQAVQCYIPKDDCLQSLVWEPQIKLRVIFLFK